MRVVDHSVADQSVRADGDQLAPSIDQDARGGGGSATSRKAERNGAGHRSGNPSWSSAAR